MKQLHQYSIHKGTISSSKKNLAIQNTPFYILMWAWLNRGHFQRQNKPKKSIWTRKLYSLIHHWCWFRSFWLYLIPVVARNLIACIISAISLSFPLCVNSLQSKASMWYSGLQRSSSDGLVSNVQLLWRHICSPHGAVLTF